MFLREGKCRIFCPPSTFPFGMNNIQYFCTLTLCVMVFLYSIPCIESIPVVHTKYHAVGKPIFKYYGWPKYWGWKHKVPLLIKLAVLSKLKLLIKLGKLGVAIKLAKKIIKPKYKYPKWVITKGIGVHKFKYWG